jgi:hypothetical protein
VERKARPQLVAASREGTTTLQEGGGAADGEGTAVATVGEGAGAIAWLDPFPCPKHLTLLSHDLSLWLSFSQLLH